MSFMPKYTPLCQIYTHLLRNFHILPNCYQKTHNYDEIYPLCLVHTFMVLQNHLLSFGEVLDVYAIYTIYAVYQHKQELSGIQLELSLICLDLDLSGKENMFQRLLFLFHISDSAFLLHNRYSMAVRLRFKSFMSLCLYYKMKLNVCLYVCSQISQKV